MVGTIGMSDPILTDFVRQRVLFLLGNNVIWRCLTVCRGQFFYRFKERGLRFVRLVGCSPTHRAARLGCVVLSLCGLIAPETAVTQALFNDVATENQLNAQPAPVASSVAPSPATSDGSVVPSPEPLSAPMPAAAPLPAVVLETVPVVPVVTLPPGLVLQDCADCPQVVVLPSGDFIMGSNEGHDDEQPRHRVSIKSFAIGKFEVTQGQWTALMGSNPSKFIACGDECPVEQVSAHDVTKYLQKLNARTGENYRLPSEAEWEYAARAGSRGHWGFGNDVSLLGQFAWFKSNSGLQTHAVGQKSPNAYGLHDLHGNVWEWVQDAYHDNYQGAPSDGSAWLTGAGQVLRGGCWIDFPGYLRSAMRVRLAPDLAYDRIGFRVAKSLP